MWFRGFAHSISRIKARNNKGSKRKTSRIWYYNYWDEAYCFFGAVEGLLTIPEKEIWLGLNSGSYLLVG